jgi:hypothetical protein
LKKVEDDPRYDKRKAEYLLKSFVEIHPHAIGEKVTIAADRQDRFGLNPPWGITYFAPAWRSIVAIAT